MDYNYILENLRTRVCSFKFKKADGTIREARGTLMPQHLPARDTLNEERLKEVHEFKKMSYWDMDANAWRAFKLENFDSFVD